MQKTILNKSNKVNDVNKNCDARLKFSKSHTVNNYIHFFNTVRSYCIFIRLLTRVFLAYVRLIYRDRLKYTSGFILRPCAWFSFARFVLNMIFDRLCNFHRHTVRLHGFLMEYTISTCTCLV